MGAACCAPACHEVSCNLGGVSHDATSVVILSAAKDLSFFLYVLRFFAVFSEFIFSPFSAPPALRPLRPLR